jgi:hypothetical protein
MSTPPADPEERRHEEIVKALYKIVEAIQSVRSELSLLKHVVKPVQPLR